MAFIIKKTINLGFLGTEWSGCNLIFSGMTFKESLGFSKMQFDEKDAQNSESLEFIMNLVKTHFVEGTGFDGTAVVNLNAEDLENLPIEVISKSVEALVGGSDTNLPQTSKT